MTLRERVRNRIRKSLRETIDTEIRVAVDKERERCARIADQFVEPSGPATDTGQIWRASQATRIAAAIRQLEGR